MLSAKSKSVAKRITNATVQAMKAGDTIRDIEIKGFGVRRRNGPPIYFLQLRIKGRLRWMTIGKHGSPWTPVSARKEALRLLSEVNDGLDLAEIRQANRDAETLAEASQRFLIDHGPKLKPRSLEEYERLIDKTIIPALGKRLLNDITRADVTKFHTSLVATPRKANFALAVLSKIMSWAELHKLRPENSNPCQKIERFTENKRQRYLLNEEVDRLGNVLHELEQNEQESPYVIAAIRLLLLTGARLNEILTLQWRYVDLQRGLLLLPDSKTGQRPIFLNEDAAEVLQGLQRQANNPFVIVGDVEGQHLINLQKPWRRIRALAGLDDLRLHDLRHSFASFAAESGASLPMIGMLLGHTQPQTTQRYAHLVADPVRDLSQAVGSRLRQSLTRGRK